MLIERGAIRVGFATLETMAGGPPGADITYLLPEAQSAIGFAIPMDKDLIRPHLGKELPNGRADHEEDNIATNIRAWHLAKDIRDFLIKKDYKAISVIPNNHYREDYPGWQASLPPELSLRYLAVRSGIASFGWSGNVGIKGYGTPIILGGIVTDAKLQPTDPLPPEESFCNKCKLCTKVCGFQMFSDNEETSITLGGYTFKYAKRINKLRCVLVCGGCTGLHKSGKFSTWSPGRYDYPEDKFEVSRLMTLAMTAQKKRPIIKDHSKGYVPASYGGKGVVQLTCGNCQLICWGDPKETAKNYKILVNSGCVIQKEDGELIVLPPEKAKIEFEKMAPKRKRLYYKDYKKSVRRKAEIVQLMP
ncbi:MAG: epoxyqueuosine reductase [Candidatus Hodarchaeota archaeon]